MTDWRLQDDAREEILRELEPLADDTEAARFLERLEAGLAHCVCFVDRLPPQSARERAAVTALRQAERLRGTVDKILHLFPSEDVRTGLQHDAALALRDALDVFEREIREPVGSLEMTRARAIAEEVVGAYVSIRPRPDAPRHLVTRDLGRDIVRFARPKRDPSRESLPVRIARICITAMCDDPPADVETLVSEVRVWGGPDGWLNHPRGGKS
ncbi:MAG: hypothetical protein V2J02_08615 [Pseudomonadales bacterium]|nr:hypothetical protein [Pseudomonadales bacterium]